MFITKSLLKLSNKNIPALSLYKLCTKSPSFQSQTSIQQHKPTPAQLYALKNDIMHKKHILHCYHLLQSRQTDSLDQIKQSYIKLKQIYNSRHYYIPNKKQFLLRLDKAYNKIQQIHVDYNYLQIGKQKGLITKSDIIQYELKAIRKTVKFRLLNSYQAAFLVLIMVLIVQILAEEYFLDKQINKPVRIRIIDQFQLLKTVKDGYLEAWQYLNKKLQGDVKPIILTKSMQNDLKALNLNIDDVWFLKNAKRPEQFLKQLKQNKENRQNK